MSEAIPLARVLAMALHTLGSDLHARLAETDFADLRPAHGFVLLRVRAQPCSVQDVAELMAITKQAASKLVANMEEAGLLARTPHPDDARAWRLELTSRGRRALRTVESRYERIEADWAQLIGRPALEAVRGHLLDVVRGQCGGELPAVRPLW